MTHPQATAQTPIALSDFGHLELVDYFDYLDDLRESGRTNMFGAGTFLREEHGLTRHEASVVLTAWMDTFDGSSKSDERVDAALASAAS